MQKGKQTEEFTTNQPAVGGAMNRENREPMGGVAEALALVLDHAAIGITESVCCSSFAGGSKRSISPALQQGRSTDR
jgi:hypothetical protein